MRRNVCRLAAVAAGLCGWGGAVAAAEPNPSLVIVSGPAAAAPSGVVPVSGCASCQAPAAHGHSAGNGTYGLKIGAGCENPVTCGSFASERNFFFGSCRTFYNPGNDCAGPHCNKRHLLYGTAGIGSHNTCEYGSFNDR